MLVLQQEPSGWLRWIAALALCLLLPLATHAADPKRNLSVSKTTPAATEQRVALVIGNANYKTAPLRNPANDAKAMADKLQGLGFKVTLKLDQDQKGMADAIRAFGNQLKAGGAGLFYYAGHGMQVKGRNFLIPVDADIQNEDEVPYRSIDANEVLSKMETAKNRLNLMILDACRNNPFSRKFRSASQGLAQMDAPSGTLVAFATAPGSVASDGSGKNGLYTQHLLANLGQSGVPVEQVFKRVRVGVMKDTRNAQVPWESSSLVGDFYFKPDTAGVAQPVKPSAAPVRVQSSEEVEQELWNAIKGSRDKRDFEDYLRQYPKGRFVPLAQQRLKALATATPTPSKPQITVASVAPLPETKPEPEPAAAGKFWTDPVTGMEFVWIPKGCFQMGSPESEKDRSSDERRHEVCVEGYWMAKYEVTNGQYRKFKSGHNGSEDDKLPVTEVSWRDAMNFAKWLSKESGKEIRLPTEAEWEYAARAGTSTAYFWGDSWDARHNFAATDVKKPVGSFQPNAFGLHDMLGNVYEWTASSYDSAYNGAERQVSSLGAGGFRVFRGGSWDDPPRLVRLASRNFRAPGSKFYNYGADGYLGFRLAREP
jgi:formylglycine-generating enzyme required for sulfatase activity